MPKYKLTYTKSAAKDIRRLDGSAKKALLAGLERLARDPHLGKPLVKELKNLYSYRVATYRIVYKIVRGQLQIIVVAVGHRKNIYERVKRALLFG